MLKVRYVWFDERVLVRSTKVNLISQSRDCSRLFFARFQRRSLPAPFGSQLERLSFDWHNELNSITLPLFNTSHAVGVITEPLRDDNGEEYGVVI